MKKDQTRLLRGNWEEKFTVLGFPHLFTTVCKLVSNFTIFNWKVDEDSIVVLEYAFDLYRCKQIKYKYSIKSYNILLL